MNTIDQTLDAIERILQPKQLGAVERFVFRQSWLGQTYGEMAKGSSYGSDYMKEVGYQLWQDLSGAFGKRVTKKNLHLVLSHYQQDKTDQQEFQQIRENWESTAEGWPESGVRSEIDFPGSPVALTSPLYINRPPVEELVRAEIEQPGCLIRIKAPKKMGKSSLLNRIVAHGRGQGYQAVHLDFQEADLAVFASLDKFLRWFCINVGRQLNLAPSLEEHWDAEMGSKVSCKIYFEWYLLKQIDSPIVLALNEVNRVFEHPQIAQDFLSMLRFWHEQSKQDRVWQKLRLVVVHTTEVYIPLKLNQSPFNVGLAISLPLFTLEQVQDLAQRYGLNWAMDEAGAKHLASLQAMVGGHPYLINLALYQLHQGKPLAQLLQAAPTPSGIYSHHLRECLTLLQGEPQLASALRQVVTADESMEIDVIAAYKLESMGLVQLDGNWAKLSCELYRLYFRKQLA